jgi:type IV pilus assembly protein PilY1
MTPPLPADRRFRRALHVATLLVAALASCPVAPAFAAPTVSISQVPLTIALPANPQVVFAIGNSQSEDGNLSGAIMTGSGSLGGNYALLSTNGYSPVTYPIPAGFTPPLNGGDGVNAPYTTMDAGGTLYDNSPSRLNTAKAGMATILNQFMGVADFALMDYQTSWPGLYDTWVYMMSPDGGPFTFTNVPSVGPPTQGVSRTVTNPCYNYQLAAWSQATSDCSNLDAFYSPSLGVSISSQQYLTIGSSSDDPWINDILYAGGGTAACIVYGGAWPANPYTYWSLGSYNWGGIFEWYGQSVNGCWNETGPTNAGFVPFSNQVMYVKRGWAYYSGWQSATTSNVVVPMTTAGAVPTTTSVNNAIAKFTPYLAPETNNSGSPEIKASAVQSPTAGLLAGALNYYQNVNPPGSNGCSPTRNVVLISDGLPTYDMSWRNWPPAGSSAATGYGMTSAFNADGSLNTAGTNDQALRDTVTELGALSTGSIKTYIIGLGAGVEPSVNPVAAQTLTAEAIAGGTGNYFPATSAAELASDLEQILAKVLAQTQSTASAAVNSTGLRSGAVVYQSQFVTSDANQDWTGELYAFPVNANTGVVDTTPADAIWSAKAKLDALNWDTGRLIATWDPVAQAGIPFRWAPSPAPLPAPQTGISPTSTLGLQLSTFTADTNGQDVLNFLRGSAAQEKHNGGAFRNRTHKLGDIVASNPMYVGLANGPSQDPTYFTFAANTASRPPVVYVGANDGMLHAFDAASGKERFAFIPNGVWRHLVKLVDPYYNAQHRFFVNGSPAAADVKFSNGQWHTVLVSGEAAGGRSVFALDVTDPTAIVDETTLGNSVLWEFTDANMGDSFSQPQIALTDAGWAVFFGNGYNSPTSTPFLYALDPKTGTVLGKLDLCAQQPASCNLGLPNGLSTVTAVNSSGSLAAPSNLVYAGDLQGNLWKIKVGDPNPANWTAEVILQATDAGGNPQPITTAPAVTLNPRFPSVTGTMVSVATGELIGIPDFSNTQVQSIYGVFDPPGGYATPLNRLSLVQQTLQTASVGSTAVRIVTGNPVAIPSQKGWYEDLSLLPGERVITDPRMETGGILVLTTYAPNPDTCIGGGSSYLMMINYANGGSFPAPQFDANGDSFINSGDAVTSPPNGFGANPVGMSLGSTYASGAVMLVGSKYTYKEITKGDTTTTTVQETGAPRRRTAWWEVR